MLFCTEISFSGYLFKITVKKKDIEKLHHQEFIIVIKVYILEDHMCS